MSGRVTIAGAIAQKPRCAGHAWQFLQYLLGFRRLGYQVLFLDRVPGEAGGDGGTWLAEVMREAGLEDSWSLDLGQGSHAGVDRRRALEFVSRSDFLLNFMGLLTDEEVLAAAEEGVGAGPSLFGRLPYERLTVRDALLRETGIDLRRCASGPETRRLTTPLASAFSGPGDWTRPSSASVRRSAWTRATPAPTTTWA